MIRLGQATTENLAVYAFGILIITVTVGVLAQYNIFGAEQYIPSSCNLNPRIRCSDYKINGTGHGFIQLDNNLDENIFDVRVKVGNCDEGAVSLVRDRKREVINFDNCGNFKVNNRYNEDIRVRYRVLGSNADYDVAGDIRTKIEPGLGNFINSFSQCQIENGPCGQFGIYVAEETNNNNAYSSIVGDPMSNAWNLCCYGSKIDNSCTAPGKDLVMNLTTSSNSLVTKSNSSMARGYPICLSTVDDTVVNCIYRSNNAGCQAGEICVVKLIDNDGDWVDSTVTDCRNSALFSICCEITVAEALEETTTTISGGGATTTTSTTSSTTSSTSTTTTSTTTTSIFGGIIDQITNNPIGFLPFVNGDIVVWGQYVSGDLNNLEAGDDIFDIYMCRFSLNVNGLNNPGGCGVEDTKTQITSGLGNKNNPTTDGNLIVWADKRVGTSFLLYGCSLSLNGAAGGCLSTDTKQRLHTSARQSPNDIIVENNKIYWLDDGAPVDSTYDYIYKCDFALNGGAGGCLQNDAKTLLYVKQASDGSLLFDVDGNNMVFSAGQNLYRCSIATPSPNCFNNRDLIFNNINPSYILPTNPFVTMTEVFINGNNIVWGFTVNGDGFGANQSEWIYRCDTSRDGISGGCMPAHAKTRVTPARKIVPPSGMVPTDGTQIRMDFEDKIIAWEDAIDGDGEIYMCHFDRLPGQAGYCNFTATPIKVTDDNVQQIYPRVYMNAIVYEQFTAFGTLYQRSDPVIYRYRY